MTGVVVKELWSGAEQRWNEYVRTHERATVFHTLTWMRVLETLHHKRCYLVALRGDRVTGILPLFQCRTYRMTCELHSLPHTNFAGPIGDDAESENALVSAAQDLAQRIGATALVLKNRYLGLVELPQLPAFVTFEKDVPGSRQDILRSFNKGARYRVKRSASRDGLTASIGFELKTFYELLASSYQRLGTPLYPRRFFEAILDHFHTSAAILIVRHGNKPVAGVLAVSFRDTMTSLFSGEAAGVRNLGPNPFKYFSLMEWALDEGLERYNFGRTRLSNPGVLDFKRHLGFEPIALPYMIVSNACSPLPDPNRGSFNLASRVWSHFPRPVAERLGPLVVSLFPY